MKKIITSLFILLLSSKTIQSQISLLEEKMGFKNIKLGSSISNYPEYKKFDRDKYPFNFEVGITCPECVSWTKDLKMTTNNLVDVYYNIPSNLTVFDRNVSDVTLVAYNGIIYRIILRIYVCPNIMNCYDFGNKKMTALEEIISKEFGQGINTRSSANGFQYYWNSESVSLRMKIANGSSRTTDFTESGYVYLTFNLWKNESEISKSFENKIINSNKKDY